MRTTINLHESALHLAKAKAEERGLPLGDVVSEAILSAYGAKAGPPGEQRYELPASGAGGVRPGVDLADSAALEELMDARG